MHYLTLHMQVFLDPTKFQFAKEDKLAPRFLRRLEPALRLASIMLHFSSPWFAKMLYGSRYTLPSGQAPYIGDVDLNFKCKDDTRRYLRDLGKNFRYFWGDERDRAGNGAMGQTNAMTRPNGEKIVIVRLSANDLEFLTERIYDVDVMHQQ